MWRSVYTTGSRYSAAKNRLNVMLQFEMKHTLMTIHSTGSLPL